MRGKFFACILMGCIYTPVHAGEIGWTTCIYNASDGEVHFSWRSCDIKDGSRTCGEWRTHTLDDWSMYTLWVQRLYTTNEEKERAIKDVNRNVATIDIKFDRSYDSGFQEQMYTLNPTQEYGYMRDCEEYENQYQTYHFKFYSSSLELHTGRGF